MNSSISKQFITQMEQVITLGKQMKSQSRHDDLSDLDDEDIHKVTSMARAVVERVSGRNSIYTRHIEEVLAAKYFDGQKLRRIIGVVESLYSDVQNGYIGNLTELLHGEVFGDFLEMARHLLEEGYKDAAAVIAGSSLEAHIRNLCDKNSIAIDIVTATGTRSKKADQMNADLTSASVYSKLDQKNITAWLDLRNKAAHGKYTEYTKEQVSLMITGIQDFVTRNPA